MNDAGRVIILPKGEYVAATTYYPLDAVIYNGNTYVAIGETTGNLPTDETYWTIFVKGATPMQGATAEADGAAGYIPKPLIADKDKFFKGDGTWSETEVSNPNLLDNGWFNVNSRGQSEYTNSGYIVDRWHITTVGTVSFINNSSEESYLQWVSTTAAYTHRLVQYISKDKIKSLIGKKVTLSFVLKSNTSSWIRCSLVPKSRYNDSTYKNEYINWSINADDSFTKYTGEFDLTEATYSDEDYVLVFYYYSGTRNLEIHSIKLELGSVSTLHLDTAPNPEEEKLRCVTSTADPLDTFANKTLQQPVGDEWSPTKTYNVGDMFIAGNQLWKTKVQHSGVIPVEGEYVEKTSVSEEFKRLNWIYVDTKLGNECLILPTNKWNELYIVASFGKTTPDGPCWERTPFYLIREAYIQGTYQITNYIKNLNGFVTFGIYNDAYKIDVEDSTPSFKTETNSYSVYYR